MGFLKKLCILFIVVVLGLFVATLLIPAKFNVERTTTIKAPASAVFSKVSNFETWKDWSAWMEKDPAMKLSYEGTQGTVGSAYSWESETQGHGKMTLKSLKANEEVNYGLKFLKPYESETEGYVRLVKVGDDTKVAWGFTGENSGASKLMNPFMDRMVGPDFERSLERLKALVEAAPATSSDVAAGYQKVNVHGIDYLNIRDVVKWSEMGNFNTKYAGAIFEEAKNRSIAPTGNLRNLVYAWDEANQAADMAVAIPISKLPNLGKPDRTKKYNNGVLNVHGNQIIFDYVGNPEATVAAHEHIDGWLKANKKEMVFPVVEEYIEDPSGDISKMVTKINYHFK